MSYSTCMNILRFDKKSAAWKGPLLPQIKISPRFFAKRNKVFLYFNGHLALWPAVFKWPYLRQREIFRESHFSRKTHYWFLRAPWRTYKRLPECRVLLWVTDSRKIVNGRDQVGIRRLFQSSAFFQKSWKNWYGISRKSPQLSSTNMPLHTNSTSIHQWFYQAHVNDFLIGNFQKKKSIHVLRIEEFQLWFIHLYNHFKTPDSNYVKIIIILWKIHLLFR